jgi:molecular chaperone DnaK
MQTINFGIDLGTTNSLIARFTGANVEVFKNPVGLKETLPSCVAFRGERIIVGDKAREWLLKDPLNVFASFKRKMGTDENFMVKSKGEFVTPIELSSLVLKELKNFIHNGEVPDSVVVTIPASFDTVQSNATKEAGYQAGFKEVVLLQEPIAASLAFFNKNLAPDKEKGKWLVYDLGGGTFDVALIGIDNSEMRVLDHQGDNYLGGVDFDHSLVMKIIVPKLIQQTGNTNLKEQILTRNSTYEKLYYILLLKAEEAKKELSNREITEIEFEYSSPEGDEDEIIMTISRDELNEVIKDRIEATLLMLEVILERNNLSPSDIEEIIMIGGSTYIPYVRETIAERTQIHVNTEADPSTAVAVGAAYFAGNKPISIKKEADKTTSFSQEIPNNLKIQTGYNTTTKDSEEYITASVTNYSGGLFYRITRTDGGFDTGVKPLTPKFGEFVLLLPGRVNSFQIRVFDAQNNPVLVEVDDVNISQGLFSLYGQPLPEDVCIEVDDLNNNSTKCEMIFARNSILPLTKTIYKEISRTIRKGSDDALIINLMEGDANQHPSTNKVVGVIEIRADKLMSDLVKGSDVEIKIEMSESRDVSVSTHLSMTDQQFNEVFSPTKRYVSILKLQDEINEIRGQLELDLDKAVKAEDFELAAQIQEKSAKGKALYEQTKSLKENALTDEKYQLDEAKRKLARQLYTNGVVNNRVLRVKERYYDLMESLQYWLDSLQDISVKHQEEIKKLKDAESEVMRSNNYFMAEGHHQKAIKLMNNVILYTPTLLVSYYHHYSSLSPEEYTNFEKVRKEIARGEKALERQHYDELRSAFMSIVGMTKNTEMVETKIKGTGLG